MTFKKWMEREDLTLADVARAAGVPKSTVHRFIVGGNRIGGDALLKLSRITKGDVPLDQIIRENEQRFRKNHPSEEAPQP